MKSKNLNPLTLFNFAQRSVEAYQDFLTAQNFDIRSVKTLKDFLNIPITTKSNYIQAYPLNKLCPNNLLLPMVSASSGSSGRSTFWMRGTEQEKRGGIIHEQIFSEIFNIKKVDKTLVIICFSMGIWVAGGFTLASCRYVSERGYQLTTVTPGIDREDIFLILKNLAPQYSQIILVGYPPFIEDVIQEAGKRKIPVHKNIKLLTAGDKFSEEWRDHSLKILKLKNPASVINLYGCADAAILGFETPLTIFLRQSATKNKELYSKLFGETTSTPGLYQYDPSYVYFENFKNELLITVKGGTPLIRYNIHDMGNVYSYRDVVEILKSYGLYQKAKDHGLEKWKLPFVTVKGRTDVSVTFYALNIYPEHIKSSLQHKSIRKYVNGNFYAYTTQTEKNGQELHINIELRKDVINNNVLQKKIQLEVLKNLKHKNTEYSKLYSELGSRTEPQVHLVKYNHNLLKENSKGVFLSSGKKPKVIDVLHHD